MDEEVKVCSEAASDGTPLYVENRFDARFEVTYRCGIVSEFLQTRFGGLRNDSSAAYLEIGVANRVGLIAKVCA